MAGQMQDSVETSICVLSDVGQEYYKPTVRLKPNNLMGLMVVLPAWIGIRIILIRPLLVAFCSLYYTCPLPLRQL
jgi:hypothetical protein